MAPSKNFLSLAAMLAVTQGAHAVFDTSSSGNVAVYWGQNSYMQSNGSLAQQRLSYYCDNTDIDVFQLAFLTVINGVGGAPQIDFANQGDRCSTFPGTALRNCPEIGEDIKACQSKGKTIILSIGGATYSEGGFSSEDAAVAGAHLVWETFGPPKAGSSAHRPFGDASVDGFDFDFESTVSNMAPFANTLRSLMDADGSKKYYLTAAPQCVYPDAADNSMLNGAVPFDAIWVQFYNNYCGLQAFSPGSSTQNNFNFATWDNWAKKTSKNPNVKVFVGVPANRGAAGSGYTPTADLAPIINYCKTFSSFGGVMMWDASQAYANSGFISGVKQALTTVSSRAMRRLFPSY
ncbi:hypothetical protein VTN02DRAFT_1940 [Thermoascus thermophilus]